ncbi:hypothetical protein FRACYDRAFT_241376 [Fragilariopsis cylindrus CCMP1102]|uniref:Uncharacterized protein n=1 Tax=Fragilariopsis cylindrus CCMP1102 TaxID=635003 RepID=A0A1E7F9H2_9STRA|nr:hypothetical protein FRACYDRAFT_241376 [Fragilariopsis cylindrus CCMP1102]|eukprot:OEU14818.1 hypothetical protein FRACYDRAFT_241376 [Fragilariopsis cylindrus CCMP1102]
MTFGNNNNNNYYYYNIAASFSCDTNGSIEDPTKRRSDSTDLDVVERSTKRTKTNTSSTITAELSSSIASSPIKLHGPFPGYRRSSLSSFQPSSFTSLSSSSSSPSSMSPSLSKYDSC